MCVMYDGVHSIIFENAFGDKKHTWTDWQLLPLKKPTLALPSASGSFVEIPGMNGSYNLTNYLTGGPTYSDRSGSWEFYMIGTEDGSFDSRISEIAEFLHGQEMKIILTDDPDYYYDGQIVLAKSTDDKIPKITLTYRAKPFKTTISGVIEAF